jgi:hypothetical protein
MVPMLLGVIEAKVIRGVALIEPLGLLDDNIVNECWSRRVGLSADYKISYSEH